VDGFHSHVSVALDGPLVIPFEQDRADEAGDGRVIGEYADHRGALLDLPVEPLDRAVGVSLADYARRRIKLADRTRLVGVQDRRVADLRPSQGSDCFFSDSGEVER